MALAMECNIVLDGLQQPITQVTEVEIDSSMDALVDSCRVVLPANANGVPLNLEENVREGQRISVEIGYTDYDKQPFSGYVSSLSPEHPFVIECEDAGWLLKQVPLNKSWEPGTATLATVVGYIIDEVNAKWPNDKIELDADLPVVTFDNMRLVRVNAAQALEQLKQDYGLSACFVPNTRRLYVGLAYGSERGELVYDIYGNIAEHDLTYKNADEVDITVKVVGVSADNEKTEVSVGDGGDERTIFKYNVTSTAELERIAEEERKKLIYSGFEGTLSAWMIPVVYHGYSAEIRDEDYPERSGVYHVDRVKSTFSEAGARNVVYIGILLSNVNTVAA